MENLGNKEVIRLNNFKIKISQKNLVIDYGNMEIKEGDFILIEGPNGCGKSTLLKVLTNESGDYCSLEEGNLFVDGKSLFSYDPNFLRRSVIVNVSQNDDFKKNESVYYALIRPAMNALCDVDDKKNAEIKIKQMALDLYSRYLFGFFHQGDEKAIKKYRENPKADLKFMYLQAASKMSGGQQKMIHIFQGIIKAKTIGCKILVMDEPLNNLDKENKKILIEAINGLRNTIPTLAILLITHCKVFPGVNTILKISVDESESTNSAELIRYDKEIQPYNCLS